MERDQDNNVEDGILTLSNTVCPECGSAEFEMRNYEMSFHEGDIHCAQCGKFIHRFDAG
jgi:ribosomal protein S27AE